jgi:hypothetical protein
MHDNWPDSFGLRRSAGFGRLRVRNSGEMRMLAHPPPANTG